MSVHYSKFHLNTYRSTPYFLAHVPEDYPIELVLQKSRKFRNLPNNLKELAGLAKQWAIRMNPDIPSGIVDIENWYDDEGYELNPSTVDRLTDKQIEESWTTPEPDGFKVKDILKPSGGFADPNTWEEEPEEEENGEYEGPTIAQLQSDIKGHGRERVAKYWGISDSDLKSTKGAEDLADLIYQKFGSSDARLSP